MKKLMAMLVLAATICMAVAGCGKKADDQTQETVKAAETAPDGSAVTKAAAEVETNAEKGLPANRQPDATAPVVDTVMVYAMVNGKIKRVPLGDVAGKLKVVDPDSQIIKQAKYVGISFGD